MRRPRHLPGPFHSSAYCFWIRLLFLDQKLHLCSEQPRQGWQRKELRGQVKQSEQTSALLLENHMAAPEHCHPEARTSKQRLSRGPGELPCVQRNMAVPPQPVAAREPCDGVEVVRFHRADIRKGDQRMNAVLENVMYPLQRGDGTERMLEHVCHRDQVRESASRQR